MAKKKILVIAFKFNDVLYASATEEYRDAEIRHIFIFSKDGSIDSFPLLHDFSRVITGRLDVSRFRQLITIAFMVIFGRLDYCYDSILLANPFLIITKFILSKVRVENFILIEDGAMNYYDFRENRAFLKRLAERLLGCAFALQKFKKTYLLRPEDARCFFGEKKGLDVSVFEKLQPPACLTELLDGKKILLGGGVIESIEKNLKLNIINRVIKDFGIDVYIPHHAFPDAVVGVDNIRLSDFGVTFECVAPLVDEIVLYTFGSTVALNAKALNKKIGTVLFKLPFVAFNNSFYELMEASVDEVVSVGGP